MVEIASTSYNSALVLMSNHLLIDQEVPLAQDHADVHTTDIIPFERSRLIGSAIDSLVESSTSRIMIRQPIALPVDDPINLESTPVKTVKKIKGRKIAEALQSEAAFTTAKDKKPIVATYGCGPCVAVGGYDSINKIAFIVHFATAKEVQECGGQIFYSIERLAKKRITRPIKIHLRGGIKGQSEDTIKAIKIWMKGREDLPMKIASKKILYSGMQVGGKSLSINSRNGRVSKYNPLSNPRHRKFTDLDAMRAMMSAFKPDIRIAYSPYRDSF